jgi:hypothetical protein
LPPRVKGLSLIQGDVKHGGIGRWIRAFQLFGVVAAI